MFYDDDYMYFTNENDANSVDLKNQNYLKINDKEYVRVKKRVFFSDGTKVIYYDLYGSKGIGTQIRNAVTGSMTNCLVGGINEDYFFKVTDSRGLNGRKEPSHYYYDSPEQYENHNFTKLDSKTKEAWYNKNLQARRKIES
jgi:hypothetical protein